MDVDLDIVWAIVLARRGVLDLAGRYTLKVFFTFNKGPAAARCSIKEKLEGKGVAGANPVLALPQIHTKSIILPYAESVEN